MLPGLYWLAGDRVRDRIDEGLSALRAVTEAASISFVDTDEVEQNDGHLARLQGEMAVAMEEERYDDARRAQSEIRVMLLPSQQSQRRLEHLQAQNAAEQVRLAVPRSEGALQRLARESWRRSVANCDSLQFAATTPEKPKRAPRGGAERPQPPAEHRRETAAAGGNADALQPAARRIGTLGSEVKGTLLEATEELHMCLALQPPAVARAAECALHMIALVGETEGEGEGEAELEMVGACVDKVIGRAHLGIQEILAGDLYSPPDPRWRHQFASALSLCKVCQELGAEDAGWELVSGQAQRLLKKMEVRGETKAEWEATVTTLVTVPEPDDDLTLSEPAQRAREEERQRDKDAAVLERLMGIEEMLSVTLELLLMILSDTGLEGDARLHIMRNVSSAVSASCKSSFARLVRGLDVPKHIAALKEGRRRVGERDMAVREALSSALKLLDAFATKLAELVPDAQDECFLSDELAAEIETAVGIYDSLCEAMEQQEQNRDTSGQ